ncbi:PPM-type phosphatase domain-containing protein [Entamoeba marina]
MTSFSTYAVVDGVKTGNPICDRVVVKLYDNCGIVIMADGCGWGLPSLTAATKAVEAASLYISQSIENCYSVRDIGTLLVSACLKAHMNIVYGLTNLMNVGTTTIHIDCPFNVLINIGDCRTFLHSCNIKHTIPLCGKYHSALNEMRNCFGRIGASKSFEPDLNSSELKATLLEPNDMLIVMTDGFHENFDPQFIQADCSTHKESFTNVLMSEMIENSANLIDLVDTFSTHIVNLTQSSRDFIQTNPKRRIPSDIKKYPGKMDHSSLCVLSVGNFFSKITAPIDWFIPSFSQILHPKEETQTQLDSKQKSVQLLCCDTLSSPTSKRKSTLNTANSITRLPTITPTFYHRPHDNSCPVLRDSEILRSSSVGLFQEDTSDCSSNQGNESVSCLTQSCSFRTPSPVFPTFDSMRLKVVSPRKNTQTKIALLKRKLFCSSF